MTADEVVRRFARLNVGRPVRNEVRRCVFAVSPLSRSLILAFVKMGGESAPWGSAYGRPGKKTASS